MAVSCDWMAARGRGKSEKNRFHHIDIRVAGGLWEMASLERLIRGKVPKLVARGTAVVRGV
jgi:hypothetical protein